MDSNNGTSESTPWQNISKVNTALGDATISQGDDIYFNRGDTWTEDLGDYGLSLDLGGNSSNWMIIGAYGTGNKPILTNTNATGDTIGVSSKTFGHLIIQDLNISNNGGDTTRASIYFHKTSDTNNITIKDVEIYNSSASHGIMLYRINYYKIENCIINVGYIDGHGIGIQGDNYATRIQNGTIRNCTISNCKDAISFHYNNGEDAGSIGPNHWIENCTLSTWKAVEEGIDISGGSRFKHILIQNCDLTDGTGGPIWMGHGSTYVVVDDVFIHDVNKNGMGITECNNTIIRNTIIDNWDETDDNAFLTQTTGWANNTYIYNCDFIHHAGADGYINFKDDKEHIFISRNNIYYSTESAEPNWCVVVNSDTFSGISSNWSHNMYWRGDNGSADETWWTDSGGTYTLAQWVAKAETRGELRADPEFADVINDDFTLNVTSPCIDAGDWLTLCNGGGTGTAITLDDAGYFFEGLSTLGVTGDEITVGTDNVTITNVDYDTNIITITPSITWIDDDPVSLRYNGTAPDIGAKESG